MAERINCDTFDADTVSDGNTGITIALGSETPGKPVDVKTRPSFISGAGAPSVLDEMWPLVSTMVDETVVIPAAKVADAVRLLFERNHVVAEGAGALPVAAALNSDIRGKIVCVITGGNIDRDMITRILSGQQPV